MGQKNSKIENSTFESDKVATEEGLVNTFDQGLNLLKIKNNIQNNQQRNFSMRTNDKKIAQVLKKNASETFSNKSTHSRSKSNTCHEKNLNSSNLFPKKSLVNNFSVFLNKDANWNNTNQNKSISYYMPNNNTENGNSELELNGLSTRSKSISEIADSTLTKIELCQSNKFTASEKKTIKTTYKFIQDDLNSVGVIAFMK